MKGMAYTPFAVMASGLLISLMMMPYGGLDLSVDGEADRIGQASFYHDRIYSDMDRAYNIALGRAMSGVTSLVVNEGVPLDQPRDEVKSAGINATSGGDELNYTVNSSMKNWANRIGNTSQNTGYRFNYTFNSVEVDKKTEFVVQSNLTMDSRLHDPSMRLYLNASETVRVEQSIEELEDPYLRIQTGDFYGHFYSRCGFDSLSQQIETANDDSGSLVWGRASINPTIDAETVTQNRILVSEDVEANYAPGDVQGFEAFISADQVANPGDYNDHYQAGIGTINDIGDNMSLVMESDVLYNTHFRDMVNEGCYMTSEDGSLNGPGFFDRLSNEDTPGTDSGLVSLIDKQELQTVNTDSNVDYVFFGDNPDQFGSTREVRGVTFGDSGSEYRSNFRVDQYHVDQWSINDLAE